MDKMSPQDKEYFEGMLFKALQSGKKETSGLVAEILGRIGPEIERSIDKHVNGKITSLTLKLDTYIKEDNEWKETATPVIEMGKNVQGFGKVSLYILGFITSITAGFYALMSFLKKN